MGNRFWLYPLEKFFGGGLTGAGLVLLGAPPELALLPQAGIVTGMAPVAAQRLPEFKEIILPPVLATRKENECPRPYDWGVWAMSRQPGKIQMPSCSTRLPQKGESDETQYDNFRAPQDWKKHTIHH